MIDRTDTANLSSARDEIIVRAYPNLLDEAPTMVRILEIISFKAREQEIGLPTFITDNIEAVLKKARGEA